MILFTKLKIFCFEFLVEAPELGCFLIRQLLISVPISLLRACLGPG